MADLGQKSQHKEGDTVIWNCLRYEVCNYAKHVALKVVRRFVALQRL